MQLSVDVIKQSGSFTGGPVKRFVEWTVNGETFKADVFVRRLSYHTLTGDVSASQHGYDLVASRIASSICHEDGSPVFMASDITGLDDEGRPIMVKDDEGNDVERGPICKSLTDALIEVINDVNGLGKRGKKLSATNNSSGTNSS